MKTKDTNSVSQRKLEKRRNPSRSCLRQLAGDASTMTSRAHCPRPRTRHHSLTATRLLYMSMSSKPRAPVRCPQPPHASSSKQRNPNAMGAGICPRKLDVGFGVRRVTIRQALRHVESKKVHVCVVVGVAEQHLCEVGRQLAQQ